MKVEPSVRELSARIDALLPLVARPARYLDSEIGAIHIPWEPDRLRWLLVFPEIYEIGMSHQGLRILYDLLNRRADALAERAFAPWPDMEDRMRRRGIPLFSLETRHPARAFDLIGLSLQYELLATNVLNLLDLSGVPIHSRDRSETDPLIVAGGPCSANPEPLADFIDFFLIGDGEEAVGEITRLLALRRGRPRRERLRALADLPGVYVPCFYEAQGGNALPPPERATACAGGLSPRDGVPYPVRRTYAERLDAQNYPRTPVIPVIEAVQDRLTLEIQRGCTQGCRFCQAGIFYRPVRERPAADLLELAASGLAASGWDEISLSSLSSADYSQIVPLARALSEGLKAQRAGLSLSSLRVDTFSVELADLVSRVRKTGLTFAPEAGTQRLREVINKRVSEDDLRAAVTAAYGRGWHRVKLYFMVGLPTETPADLDGVARAVRELREIGRGFGPSRGVTVSLSPFVPKAHTPFQWEAFGGREELRERIAYLEKQVASRWTPLKSHNVDLSFVEALLARGDRRMGRVIERVWRAGGRFEGWTEHFSIARWEEALGAEGIDARAATGARDPAAPLPWDHIDLGVSRAWLLGERERALRGEVTDDCRGGACTACGLGGPADRRLSPEIEPAQWQALSARLAEALAPAQGAGAPGPAGAGVQALTLTATAQSASPLRLRLCYAKRANLRFLSHLETGRLLLRLLRMARWPLVYTQGHNPHPRVAFGPPLPVGVEGVRELIDLFLARAPSAQEQADLASLAPPGFAVRGLTEIAAAAPSLTALAATAAYLVLLPADLAARARQERRIEQFHEAQAVPLLKAGKGRQRCVDLKRAVAALAWGEAAGSSGGAPDERESCAETPEDAPGEARHRLEMTLCLQEPGGHVAGPFPVLREVLKLADEDVARCSVTRLRFFDAAHGLLDGRVELGGAAHPEDRGR